MDTDDLVLFTETVADRFLDIFSDDFQLKSEYKNTEIFKKHIVDILKNYKIRLQIIKTSKQNVISGEYFVGNNSIILNIPVRRVSLQEFMNALLHEFAHFIVEFQVPGIFNPRTEDDLRGYTLPINEDLKNPYKLFGLFLEKNRSSLWMSNMLKHWTQAHERSNWAFSIAYDIYNENRLYTSLTIKTLIDSHLECWKKYHADRKNLKYLDDYMRKFKTNSELTFFAIIFYRQELLSRRELIRDLILNTSKLINLVEKYYRRISGILHNTKNSQTYLQF